MTNTTDEVQAIRRSDVSLKVGDKVKCGDGMTGEVVGIEPESTALSSRVWVEWRDEHGRYLHWYSPQGISNVVAGLCWAPNVNVAEVNGTPITDAEPEAQQAPQRQPIPRIVADLLPGDKVKNGRGETGCVTSIDAKAPAHSQVAVVWAVRMEDGDTDEVRLWYSRTGICNIAHIAPDWNVCEVNATPIADE